MGGEALDLLLDGSAKALENAERLLRSADAIADIDEGLACFTVVMAWEELGKALRLAHRAHDVFQNAAIEIDSELFNAPEVAEMLIRDLEEFGKFGKSSLRSHTDKLTAFREHFSRHRVVDVSDDEVKLAKIDPFQGREAMDIVLMSRRAILIDYFQEDGSFKQPLPMFANPREVARFNLEHEVPAVQESVDGIRRSIEGSTPVYEERERIARERREMT